MAAATVLDPSSGGIEKTIGAREIAGPSGAGAGFAGVLRPGGWECEERFLAIDEAGVDVILLRGYYSRFSRRGKASYQPEA
jgi:hypothetical protein